MRAMLVFHHFVGTENLTEREVFLFVLLLFLAMKLGTHQYAATQARTVPAATDNSVHEFNQNHDTCSIALLTIFLLLSHKTKFFLSKTDF